jgi:hypothetical protein
MVVGNRIVLKQERDNTNKIHKTIQKHRTHKAENKNTKQKTNIKEILKTISHVI